MRKAKIGDDGDGGDDDNDGGDDEKPPDKQVLEASSLGLAVAVAVTATATVTVAGGDVSGGVQS